ncbi:glycosyl hydrolase family 28 protein [Paenibacillus aceti]|uniref:Glycoside hydrolase n=1 Tax=Paenibacillus aceti TaxID=1820010 RepID=A0ABQ1VQN0_9BACL|nr:glycosyl hydrolase family 28 protein [Paenibacillus aceti]GGF90367.1 hypothetical protein GCM10010913_09790 [Paenibacillus aceti]
MEAEIIINSNGTIIKIDRAPVGIGYAADEERLRTQGEDAFAPDPEGLVLSRDWELYVEGQAVPVYAAPITNGGPLSFASLSFVGDPGSFNLIAKRRGSTDSAVIRPLSLGIEAKLVGQEIHIPVDRPAKIIVEANGNTERPLVITLHAKEEGAADPTDSKVKYYGPGLHKVSSFELQSGESLYIAGGAVLQLYVPEDEAPVVASDWANKPNYVDFITAEQAESIRIHGRGIIDMSMLDWHARKAMLLTGCRDVSIEGLTIVGTSHWTVHLSNCVDSSIADLTLIGYRENSDGIDIVNCERIQVTDCFIRTGDDAVAVKAMDAPPAIGGRDIYVSDCTVWNDKVRCFGIAGETRTDISDVIFENCNVVHSTAVWTEEVGSLCIVVGDRGTISNIRFENITIEEERQHAMICLIFKDRWSIDQEPGQILNITFRNIKIPEGTASLFHGSDASHIVDGVHIEGLVIGGKQAEMLENLPFKVNEFVKNLTVS